MIKVLIKQLINEPCHNSAWMEFGFESDFPPVPGMILRLSPKNSVEANCVCYNIFDGSYTCYPNQFSIDLRPGRSLSFAEAVKYFEDMGFKRG